MNKNKLDSIGRLMALGNSIKIPKEIEIMYSGQYDFLSAFENHFSMLKKIEMSSINNLFKNINFNPIPIEAIKAFESSNRFAESLSNFESFKIPDYIKAIGTPLEYDINANNYGYLLNKFTEAANSLSSLPIFKLIEFDKVNLNDNIIKFINYDIGQSNDKKETADNVQKVLVEAQEVLESIEINEDKLFKLFVSILKKIFNADKIKSLTQEFIYTLILQTILSVIGLNDESIPVNFNVEGKAETVVSNNNLNVEVDNSKTYNIDSRNYIINETTNDDICVSYKEKELYVYKNRYSKVICVIPPNTELSIVKKYKIWMVVTFVDQNGVWQTGYVTMDEINFD